MPCSKLTFSLEKRKLLGLIFPYCLKIGRKRVGRRPGIFLSKFQPTYLTLTLCRRPRPAGTDSDHGYSTMTPGGDQDSEIMSCLGDQAAQNRRIRYYAVQKLEI